MQETSEADAIWPSYADLMTGLFAVVLSLFVLSYWLLKSQVDLYKLTDSKVKVLQEVEESVRNLEDERYFKYQPEFKRHVFRQEVRFATGDAQIPNENHAFLREAGLRLAQLVRDLSGRGSNLKYVLIIEGMASKDDYASNFDLSYRRALALYRLWNEMAVRFDPAICEVIIAGSGTEGAGRYEGAQESLNQRFLIQILPKIGAQELVTEGAKAP